MKNAANTLLVLVLLFSIFVPSRSAQADIAPPPAPQLGGLEPFQYQDTHVQMVYERVEMEILPTYDSDNGFPPEKSRVYVTAFFTMRNLGKLSENMQVIFPLESFTRCESGVEMGVSYSNYYIDENSFEVMVSGSEIPIQKIITDHPHAGCNQMSWAGFEVAFPIEEDVVIQVSYVMESYSVDNMQNIEYILETGAGWFGSIKRGYVIFKFPYVATTENVLDDTTDGYQFLYNEIFWSFENLEPTSENNIQISIVSPGTWLEILSLRRDLKENPASPDKWLKLAELYTYISTWHGANIRDDFFYKKIPGTYELGIASNPGNSRLYASYAEFILNDCCYYMDRLDSVNYDRILNLINKTLALDPDDPTAPYLLSAIESANPNLTFTPPPTVPPTATSQFTLTPTITPSATITPTPTETPVVVTVVHTKVVNPTPKSERTTATVSPTETFTQAAEEEQNRAGSFVGGLVLFLLGIGAGAFWQKRRISQN